MIKSFSFLFFSILFLSPLIYTSEIPQRDLSLSIQERSLSLDAEKSSARVDVLDSLKAIKRLYQKVKDHSQSPELEPGSLVKLADSYGFQSTCIPMHAGAVYEFSLGDSVTLIDSQRNLIYLNLDNETPVGFGEIMHDPFLVIRTKPTNRSEAWEIKDSWENLARFPIPGPSAHSLIPLDFELTSPSRAKNKLISPSENALLHPRIAVVNQTDCFDHTSPHFMLSSLEKECDKIWWQISDTPDFSFVIPNFEAIQSFENVITLDALTETFFNPEKPYYFRVKAHCQGHWCQWSLPFVFCVKKPDAVSHVSFVKLAKDSYELRWKKFSPPDTTYLIFASNSRDFVPSLYTDKQINALHNSEIVDFEPNENCLLETQQNSIQIDGKFAYYRLVAQRNGYHSTPSPLVYVYDQGLTHCRDILQLKMEMGHSIAKRTAFPHAYQQVPFHDQSPLNLKTVSVASILGWENWIKSPYVNESTWEMVEPYLLPENHPIREQLDRIFCVQTRVIASSDTLKEAGFPKPNPRPYSHAIISHHPLLKGYLVKMFSDSQPKVVDWEQWLRRIKGAISIQEFIIKYDYADFFKVPKKWIYPLPAEPSPSEGSFRKNFICVVEDMEILEKAASYAKWKGDYMTPEKLEAIFHVLKEEGLSDSVRAFNLPIAKDDKIAILDTEHHHKWPVRYAILAEYLSPEMQVYWQSLIDNDAQ